MGIFSSYFFDGGNIGVIADSIANHHKRLGVPKEVFKIYYQDYTSSDRILGPKLYKCTIAKVMLEDGEILNYRDLAILALFVDAAPKNQPYWQVYEAFASSITKKLRARGIPEELITGNALNASDRIKNEAEEKRLKKSRQLEAERQRKEKENREAAEKQRQEQARRREAENRRIEEARQIEEKRKKEEQARRKAAAKESSQPSATFDFKHFLYLLIPVIIVFLFKDNWDINKIEEQETTTDEQKKLTPVKEIQTPRKTQNIPQVQNPLEINIWSSLPKVAYLNEYFSHKVHCSVLNNPIFEAKNLPTGIQLSKEGAVFGYFPRLGTFTFQVRVNTGHVYSEWKSLNIEVRNLSEKTNVTEVTKTIPDPPITFPQLKTAEPLEIKKSRKINGFKVVDTKNLRSGFLTIESHQLQKPQLSGTYEMRDEFNDKLLAKGEVLGVSYYRIVFKNVFNYASERELKKAKVYIYRKSF